MVEIEMRRPSRLKMMKKLKNYCEGNLGQLQTDKYSQLNSTLSTGKMQAHN